MSPLPPSHLSADAPAVPPPWSAAPGRSEWFRALRGAQKPLLICDYDGTLAPFQKDKMQAYVYDGVAERLAAIAATGSRLAFVTGRPVAELITLLPLAAEGEIWGMHGREHRTPDGGYRRMEPSDAQRNALDTAQASLTSAGLGALLERKAASVALHWRTLDGAGDQARLTETRKLAEAAFLPHAGRNALALLPFDGGLELRAEDQNKGHATAELLAQADARHTAFLGDDTTDEDAFLILRARGGLGMLVREPARPSHAHYALRPPEELLQFLQDWQAARQ